MNYREIIAWVATLPENSPELAKISAIRHGADLPPAEKPEPFFTLAEIGREVRKCPTWLHRLEIQRRCGERLAGRFMYRRSRVLAFLRSQECMSRIACLREKRKARK